MSLSSAIKKDLRDENHSIHQTRSLKRGSLKPTPLSSYKEEQIQGWV